MSTEIPATASSQRAYKRAYKRDWAARKPFYIVKTADAYYVQINERRLITKHPHDDLIASLEEMLASAKAQKANHDPDAVS